MSASLCFVCKQGSTCPISETKSSTQIFGREYGLNFFHIFNIYVRQEKKIQHGEFRDQHASMHKIAKLKLKKIEVVVLSILSMKLICENL